jgi:hypothetical protein
MKIINLLILTILSGIVYRLGGIGKPFKTWMRDWICPLFFIITLLLWFQPKLWWNWFLFIPIYGLMGAALTTYWDFIFGYDNYWAHGFVCGIATFLLYWLGIHWWAILIYSIMVSVGMGFWSKIISNDFVEEFGRGFVLCIFIPLLLL